MFLRLHFKPGAAIWGAAAGTDAHSPGHRLGGTGGEWAVTVDQGVMGVDPEDYQGGGYAGGDYSDRGDYSDDGCQEEGEGGRVGRVGSWEGVGGQRGEGEEEAGLLGPGQLLQAPKRLAGASISFSGAAKQVCFPQLCLCVGLMADALTGGAGGIDPV